MAPSGGKNNASAIGTFVPRSLAEKKAVDPELPREEKKN